MAHSQTIFVVPYKGETKADFIRRKDKIKQDEQCIHGHRDEYISREKYLHEEEKRKKRSHVGYRIPTGEDEWDLTERMSLWLSYNKGNKNAQEWIDRVKQDMIRLGEDDSTGKQILLGLEGIRMTDPKLEKKREKIFRGWQRTPRDLDW